jgi:hypothetical protein
MKGLSPTIDGDIIVGHEHCRRIYRRRIYLRRGPEGGEC